MGVKAIDIKLCNGCGICVQDCPSEVFRIDNASGKAYIAYPEDCVDCKLCHLWPTIICPAGAIDYSADMSDKVFFPYHIEDFPAKGPLIFKEEGFDS